MWDVLQVAGLFALTGLALLGILDSLERQADKLTARARAQAIKAHNDRVFNHARHYADGYHDGLVKALTGDNPPPYRSSPSGHNARG